MLPPQKPWEIAAVNQRALPSVSNSDVLQSSAAHMGSYAGTTHLRSSHRNPPPVPSRSSRQYQAGSGLGYSNSGYYNSPYSSYGGYGSGFNNYSGYGYGGYGGYGNYGSYNSYGGFGMNRHSFPHSMPESRFIQMAEDGSRPAFQSIESLVHAFGSVSFMLESTFNAMYSSFRAVLGVAENFGRLRALFGQFLSVFAVFRWMQWLYKKCLYLLGLSSVDPGREQLWRQATQAVAGGNIDPERQRTSWPIMVFLGIIISGPYLMWKLLSSIDVPNIDPNNPKDWLKCKEPGLTAVALYDFAAASSQELSLRAGQKMFVAPRELQNHQSWLMASVDGRTVGLIPSNYIKILGRMSFNPRKETDSQTGPSPMNVVPDVPTNNTVTEMGDATSAQDIIPEPCGVQTEPPVSTESSKDGQDAA